MVWFLTALFYVGLYTGSAILSAILNRNSSANQTPGEPQFPKADPQAPVPVVYGTTRVGMNVIHKAHVTLGENTVRNGALSFGWSSTTIGKYYYLDLLAVICHGPVDCLHDVIVDGTRFISRIGTVQVPYVDSDGLIDYTTTSVAAATLGFPAYSVQAQVPIDITIAAGDILGGKMDRGGIGAGSMDAASTGLMKFWAGYGAISHNTRLETLAGTDLPCYPNLCTVAFGPDFYFGNQPSLPGIEFVVSRAGRGPGMGTGYIGNNTANAGHEANPAFILYDLLTNTTYGLGIPASDISDDSFIALSRAVDQGLDGSADFDVGLSFVLSEPTTGKSVITDLLRTLDGVLYTDPTTGLLCVRLLRAPDAPHYSYSTPITLDESVIETLTWTESAPDAQVNEVKVEFIDRARDYTKNTAIMRNVAAIQSLGRVESRTVSFLGVQTAALANRFAHRELRALSTSVGHATLRCHRIAVQLTPGQFFTLDWAPRGIANKTMRVVSVREAPAGQIEIEAVEDVYSTPDPTFATETTPEPVAADDTAFLAPYVEPQFQMLGGFAVETLLVVDPQTRVTAVEFTEETPASWHAAVNPTYWSGPYTPYVNAVNQALLTDTAPGWRVSYTAADGTTQFLIGGFPDVPALGQTPPPVLRWSVSGGTVTVTAEWQDGLTPDLYLYHSSSGFVTYTPGDTPVTAPHQITFPYPAAGAVEYVSAVRIFTASTLSNRFSDYAYLTIEGGDLATEIADRIEGDAAALAFPFGDGTTMEAAGVYRTLLVPFGFTVTSAAISAFDSAGAPANVSATFSVRKSTAGASSVDMIGGGVAPAISAAAFVSDLDTSDWTTPSASAFDTILVKLLTLTAGTAKRLDLTLLVSRP